MSDKPIESMQDILGMMNPEVHMNLKTAVELGRWQDGRKLTPEQIEYCLQAIIAYEQQHLPEDMRVGYIDRTGLKKTQCDDDNHSHDHERVEPLKIITH
ncbi:MAG: DUF1315 family protein [Pseudohongiella sp.]|nr:DUF1315 family protein [Pseudohongiella sp.]MDO9521583.1 DUF1315 family protein [Pseudohongiella sp.]MDP2127810.1 DUF1315 family protein [Pseudohongiella sp.]